MLYTTEVQLDKERFIETTRQQKAETTIPVPSKQDIAWALDRQPNTLDKEQRNAVIAARSSSSWVHIEGHAGSGKCLDSEMEITDPKTGIIHTLEEVIRKDELTHVLTLNDDKSIVGVPITEKIDSGWKPTLKVTFGSGREMITTYHHPYLTPDGWKRADELTTGGTTGLAARIPEPTEPVAIPDAEVDVLAVLLTNGGISPSTKGWKFSSPDPEIVRRMRLAGYGMGFNVRPVEPFGRRHWDYYLTGTTARRADDRLAPSTIRVLMERHGIDRSLSKNKTIPESVFRLPDAQLARFLAVFWMSDGYVDKDRAPALVLASETMLRQVQHLLLRFGIQSGIKAKPSRCNGKVFDAWRLSVYSASAFADNLPLWGEKGKRARAIAVRKSNPNVGRPKITAELADEIMTLARTGVGTHHKPGLWDRTWKEAGYPSKRSTSQLFSHPGVLHETFFRTFCKVYGVEDRYGWLHDSDIWWDRIVSIEDAGERHVYDLTVAPTACFVAGDVIVHNTSSMKAAIDAHKRAGTVTQVVVVSTAASTAQRTGRKLEADRWGSVESVARQVKMGSIHPSERTLIIVDEAAMMDTHRMAALLKTTGKARIVNVGDSAQLSAIGPAGWYQESVAQHGGVTLTRVHRHKDHRDVRDYNLLRQGRSERALENLAMRDRVHVSDDRSDKVKAVMVDYRLHREHGYTADQIRMIADTSNRDIDTLNRFAQRDRLSRGEIKGPGFEVEDDEQERRWKLYEGDSILFLRSYMERGAEPIRNGSTGVILSLNERTGRARVVLEGDRIATVNLKESEHSQPLGLAYAQHAAKIQGGEVPIVQVLPGRGTTNANSGYSQVTRAQHEAHIYLDRDTHTIEPVKTLAEAWAQPIEKRTAMSYRAESEKSEKLRNPRDFSPTSALIRPTNRFADVKLATKATDVESYLRDRHGDEITDKITSSPGYPSLVVKVSELERDQSDALAMVSEAVEDRELDSAQDPAGVLVWRLDHTPERAAEPSIDVPESAEVERDMDWYWTRMDEIDAELEARERDSHDLGFEI